MQQDPGTIELVEFVDNKLVDGAIQGNLQIFQSGTQMVSRLRTKLLLRHEFSSSIVLHKRFII